MSTMDLIQRVYRVFEPKPLGPEQQALYVDLQAVRGNTDVVSRLARTIQLAEANPTCQVLAGHRGSGKSTELLRLKRRLETGSPAMFVVYVRADEYLDRNDIDFPEVLIAMVRQMAQDLNERAKIRLKPGYFKDRIERLKSILTSTIDFENFELNAALFKVAAAIKGSPDARAEIRKLLEPDTSNLIDAANDVISEAVLRLGKQGKSGLVLLMDDLDKMVVREHAATGGKTDEYLFVNRAAQLTGFRCHVVYTMPLSLAYSHQENAIRNSYGGHVPVVPMTMIAQRPPRAEPYGPGMEKFRDIIVRRLEKAAAKDEEVFADRSVRDELVRLSGGQPTELMSLVREAIIAHQLPIDAASLERAKVEGRREYARQLRADHWPILEEVRSTGSYVRTIEREPAWRELLEGRAILQYAADEEWYALNPMVALLNPPRSEGLVMPR